MRPNKPISKAFERGNNVYVVKLSQFNLLHGFIKVHNVLLIALVGTGSDATIFNINAYNKFGSPALKNTVICSLPLVIQK